MDRSTFTRVLTDLYGYFNRKPLGEVQERVYWKAVKDYQDEALTQGSANLMRGERPTAGGFPSAQDLVAACHAHCESHPQDKTAQVEEHFCGECGGRGYLESYLADDPFMYESVVRCGHCENWKRRLSKSVPMAMRQDLVRHGRVLTRGPYSRQEWDESLKVGKAELLGMLPGLKPIQRMIEVEEEEPPF